MKTKADTDQDLVTLNDERLRQLIDEYNDENLPPQETLSIDTIERYCRMCAKEEGSDSDKASEYKDYIWKTLRVFNDTVREKVFDEHAPWDMVRLPQIDSLDEDLAECLSPVRCRLVLPNLEEVSKDCLDLLFSKKNKITLSRKYYHYHCLEIGLKSLDKAQATVLGKYTGQLSLPNLESIDAEAAKKLRGIAWNLRLGIREIDLETAKALTDLLKKSQGRNLYLDRLTSISTEALKVLCENEGELSLGLEEVNAEQMALLTARKVMFELPKLRHCPAEALQLLVDFHSGAGYSEYGCLELNSFEELSVEGAAIVAKTKKATLSLNGLKSITAEVAKSLSSFRGNLFLKGIAEIDADAAAHLASVQASEVHREGGLFSSGGVVHNHHLELGAKTIDKNAAAELARFGGTLNLPALTELPAAAAEALAGHKGKRLYLGLQSLSENAAKALAGYEGDLFLKDLKSLEDAALAGKLASWNNHLKLNSLTELFDMAAEALAGHKGGALLLGLQSLSDAAAESLSKYEGDLHLDGLTTLSDAAAESLSKHEGDLHLDGLTSISDAAAESLCKYEGDIYLNGLAKLSDGAAQSFSKHTGTLFLRQLTELSPQAALCLLEIRPEVSRELDLKAIAYSLIDVQQARRFLENDIGDVDLSRATAITDEAARILAKYEGCFLNLESLTDLSNDAIKALASYKGSDLSDLSLGLTELCGATAAILSHYEGILRLPRLPVISEAAANSLCEHRGVLSLAGLTELSDAAAESLSKYEDQLSLDGLTELSDTAAESLAKHKGGLFLNGITSLSDAAIGSLSRCAYVKFGSEELTETVNNMDARETPEMIDEEVAQQFLEDDESIDLSEATEITDAAAEILAGHEGYLELIGLTSLTDAAGESLSKHKGEICDQDPAEWADSMRG